MPFKSEKQRKWMWANDPEMAEKWENEEKNESRKLKVTENELRGIVRRTLLAEQDVAGAIKMLMDTLDDNQKADLAASMSDPSKPSGTSGSSGTGDNDEAGMIDPSEQPENVMDLVMGNPDSKDAATDAISQDPEAMESMIADNPEAIEDAVDANPGMLQGFLEDPSIMGKFEDMLTGSDFLKGILAKTQGPAAAEALGELGENTVRLTRRQLRKIIREAIGDQLPYRHGQPWQDPDMPVGRGAEVYDDPLDRELTDEEMNDAGYFEEEGWPLRFGYTDKTGEIVEFIANNNADADEFFSMFFKEYGRDYPYSVN